MGLGQLKQGPACCQVRLGLEGLWKPPAVHDLLRGQAGAAAAGHRPTEEQPQRLLVRRLGRPPPGGGRSAVSGKRRAAGAEQDGKQPCPPDSSRRVRRVLQHDLDDHPELIVAKEHDLKAVKVQCNAVERSRGYRENVKGRK